MKTFSQQEVYDIYQNYVNKPESYFKKYEKLPLSTEELSKWDNRDFPRVMCVLEFQEWVKKHNLPRINKLLSTDLNDPELQYLDIDKAYHAPYYNGNNDLHTLDLQIKDFDFIMFNQTVEHLYNPFMSMEKLYNHLSDDGYLFTSMPTINIPHMVPFHFNGMTPMGLCMLMKSVGFKILDIGFWGNMDYINYIFEKQDWPDHKYLMKDGIITNEKNREVQCWILVQK
jgi:hypothetical protein